MLEDRQHFRQPRRSNNTTVLGSSHQSSSKSTTKHRDEHRTGVQHTGLEDASCIYIVYLQ